MITIVPYQSPWSAEFIGVGRDLRRKLGSLAVRVDHIGSTSVPGLAAKDILDVQVTVTSWESEIRHALQTLGYVWFPHVKHDHVPPGLPAAEAEWTKWFFRGSPDQRPVNLHVPRDGLANQRYPLLFRDYLRKHPAAVESYAQVKSALARRFSQDVDAYYEVKDPVCDLIAQAAEMWAQATGWMPGPSDQ